MHTRGDTELLGSCSLISLGAPGFSLKPAWPSGAHPEPPTTSYSVTPHPTIGPQRDPDSAADAAGQVKGSGGKRHCCLSPRPSAGLVPGRQGVSRPLVGVCQSHSPAASGPGLAGHTLPSGRDGGGGMERSGEEAVSPPASPHPTPAPTPRGPDLTIPGDWTWPHPSLRVTTLGRGSGSRPNVHSWGPNP